MLYQPSSGGFGGGSTPSDSGLGQEYLLNEDGELSPVSGSKKHSGGTSTPTVTQTVSKPAPTLVGKSGGFQINLVWDSSVASAPAGFTAAVIAAATYYTTLFSNKMV